MFKKAQEKTAVLLFLAVAVIGGVGLVFLFTSDSNVGAISFGNGLPQTQLTGLMRDKLGNYLPSYKLLAVDDSGNVVGVGGVNDFGAYTLPLQDGWEKSESLVLQLQEYDKLKPNAQYRGQTLLCNILLTERILERKRAARQPTLVIDIPCQLTCKSVPGSVICT